MSLGSKSVRGVFSQYVSLGWELLCSILSVSSPNSKTTFKVVLSSVSYYQSFLSSHSSSCFFVLILNLDPFSEAEAFLNGAYPSHIFYRNKYSLTHLVLETRPVALGREFKMELEDITGRGKKIKVK